MLVLKPEMDGFRNSSVKKIEKCKKEMSRPTSSRPSSAKPNTVAVLPNLKGFVFTEKLGSGTYATVYKAYKKVLDLIMFFFINRVIMTHSSSAFTFNLC